jgi:aspartyl-tRNA(Asn)/glutamyl-tRNA(Gln) amidotransferase subunit A
VLTRLSAADLVSLVKKKSASVPEIVTAHIERTLTVDPQYRAFLSIDPDLALKRAEEIQRKIDLGEDLPLAGVPVAIKDNISAVGFPMTCGSRILEGYQPPYDATVVERIESMGAIIVGKANLDEFAMGTTCENSAFFPSRNPWDPARVPGGSSGGSAVAVSAEMVPVALGSDTGGSVRMPAALCGLVGFKPTYGRVSRYGLVAYGSSLDQIGPLTRSVEDASLIAAAVSGHDPRDSTSRPDPPIEHSGLKSGSLAGLRIAVPRELTGDAVEPGILSLFQKSIQDFEKEGAHIESIDMPSLQFGVSTYYVIAPAEASSNLARFDGIRYGPQVKAPGHVGQTAMTRGQLFGHEVKLRIMVGTYVLSAGYYDDYYVNAQRHRANLVAEFEKVFQDFDFVLSPTSPSVAFPLGSDTHDSLALKLLDLCTIPANLGGFPSISLPCGLSDGLPVGLCLTGPVGTDEMLLKAAYAAEQTADFLGQRPPEI